MTETLIVRTARSGIERIRSLPALSALTMLELYRERSGGHEALPDHGAHIAEALDWIVRSQDITADGGFARAYGLTWHHYFGVQGWQPSYPETTGYIIPTLYYLARALDRPDLAIRADRAALWEIDVQLESGAVRGGVVGEYEAPAIFNTGQVLFGWLSALKETGCAPFAAAAERAGRYLVSVQDADGFWRRENSPFADPRTTLYNARTAWALAEAGRRLCIPVFRDAAVANLRAVVSMTRENGWIPDCCLTDRSHPLLHTLAYAIQGLAEGGRVLEDDEFVRAAAMSARPLAERVASDGRLPGRFAQDWSSAADWSCLTGQAQMVSAWIRLYELTGDDSWVEPVPRVLQFLKTTQNRTSSDAGLRGGIKGSFPLDGSYGRYQVLSWATKFYVDALVRHQLVLDGRSTLEDDSLSLA